MLASIRKFSQSIFAKIFLGLVAIPFIFWGMGSVFTSGTKNIVVVIDKDKHSTKEFFNYNDLVKDIDCLIICVTNTPIAKDVAKEILDKHISFWLNWDPKTLVNRIKKSKKRPVAFKSSKNELLQLIKGRNLIYSNALYKINCENLSKNEIVNNILKIYEAH